MLYLSFIKRRWDLNLLSISQLFPIYLTWLVIGQTSEYIPAISRYQIYHLSLIESNIFDMKSIANKIKQKGVTKAHVAKMVGTDTSTLSRIISGKQSYVSKELLKRINLYLDSINTDDKNILK